MGLALTALGPPDTSGYDTSVKSLDELIGESPPIQALRATVQRFLERQRDARRIPSVLLLGETGTGKSLLAKLMHRGSPRAEAPFIDVNCAAIPDALMEAELFGFERGAFTDARQAKAGLFQAAHHGTIFLDEIALLNEGLQGKLLKILDERVVRRLGSTRSEPVDVWVIAATSEDLLNKTRDGGFREDLYHRLAVITLTLPPLRTRGGDIVLLADTLLKAACVDYGLPPKSLGADARRAVTQYAWPGNVRELGNAMERAALLCEVATVAPEHLTLPTSAPPSDTITAPAPERWIDARRREELLAVLTQTNWNITRTAAQLLIARNTLRARIRRYGLRDPNTSPTPTRPAVPASVRSEPPRRPSPERAPGHAGILWESRRLTLLRVEVSAPYGEMFSRASSQVFETVLDKIRSFGGRIEEVTPTAVMTVFGLEPVDEGPRRAANAALAIHRALRRTSGDGAVITLALHFAEMLVARINGGFEIDVHSKREAWTVLDSLNDQAKPEGIMVSAPAAALLNRHYQLILPGGPDRLAHSAHRLIGPERRDFASDGRVTAFTGRHYELDVLRRRLGAAIDGQGQAVGLVGEPGIGKSRLLHEFRRTLDGRCRILEAECSAHGRGFSYLPITVLLRGLLGVNEGDDPRVIRDTVSRQFSSFRGPNAADGVAAALALLGCLPDDDAFFTLTPAQRRRRTLEAFHQLLLAEAQRQPLIVVIEDLQWIDLESEATLDYLFDRISNSQLLLLYSYRPEYAPAWKQKGPMTELTLEPLSPASVHAVLEDLLGTDARLKSLKELIFRRTEGNPFFIEETVRTLLEARIVVGAPGAYEMVEAIDAIDVPPTVQAVIGARIDRLGPDERRLLQAAAVIGQKVPLALLAAIVEMPDEAREGSLAALQRANFLYESREVPEPTCAFTHALTCEVAQGSSLPEERRRLRARVVSSLEAMPSEGLLDHLDTVAHHAYEGELWEKASGYYRQAARRAMSRSAYRAAVFCLERAVAAVGKLPPTSEVLGLAVDIRFDLRNALWALGELSRGLDYLREAEPLAEALGDRRRLARLFARTSFNALILGDNDGALEAGERALRLAEEVGDAALEVESHQYLGLLHNSLGDYQRSTHHLESIVRALSNERQHGPFTDYYAVHSRTWLVWSLCELGELERAMTLAGEAAALAEASNQPYNIVASKWALGLLHLAMGQAVLAIPVLEQGLSACRAADVAIWLRPSVALLGRALAVAGRCAEALPLLEQAMCEDENRVAVPAWETYLAEACMLDGRLDEAMAHARHAAESARQRKEHGFLAHAHRQRAQIAERRGAAGEAREHYLEAMRLARDRGMRRLIAECELGAARLSSPADSPMPTR